MINLFYDSNNRLFTNEDIKHALLSVGAKDCEALFIHSDVMFGKPVEGFKRREYLNTLYEIIGSLGVKNLIIPTFTYSFCNSEDYDIEKSRTSMGAFNEFIRKQAGRYRTDDPLLSLSVPEELRNTFSPVSAHSLGKNSGLDIIHQIGGVKFLFLGAEMAECFTYVHYVEKMMDVPYRFDMPFEGHIIYPDGHKEKRTQYIHTQCKGAVLPQKYLHFEREMEEAGYLKKEYIGDKYIACISEEDAFREISNHIESDINYFLAEPFREKDLMHEYTYSIENGRITHC